MTYLQGSPYLSIYNHPVGFTISSPVPSLCPCHLDASVCNYKEPIRADLSQKLGEMPWLLPPGNELYSATGLGAGGITHTLQRDPIGGVCRMHKVRRCGGRVCPYREQSSSSAWETWPVRRGLSSGARVPGTGSEPSGGEGPSDRALMGTACKKLPPAEVLHRARCCPSHTLPHEP